MSVENVKGFIEALGGDQHLQETLGAARDPGELGRLVAELSAARGLPVTAEEFLPCVAPQGTGAREIGIDQLDAVVGGAELPPEQLAKLITGVLNWASRRGETPLDSLTPSQTASITGGSKPPV